MEYTVYLLISGVPSHDALLYRQSHRACAQKYRRPTHLRACALLHRQSHRACALKYRPTHCRAAILLRSTRHLLLLQQHLGNNKDKGEQEVQM